MLAETEKNINKCEEMGFHAFEDSDTTSRFLSYSEDLYSQCKTVETP